MQYSMLLCCYVIPAEETGIKCCMGTLCSHRLLTLSRRNVGAPNQKGTGPLGTIFKEIQGQKSEEKAKAKSLCETEHRKTKKSVKEVKIRLKVHSELKLS